MTATADLKPPRQRLGLQPTIESPADIGTALEELSWLQAVGRAADADCQQAIRKARQECEKKLLFRLEGEELRVVDREDALRAAIAEYSIEHRAELLEGKQKSREFTHGEICWKLGSPAVECVEGTKEAEALATIGNKLDRKVPLKEKFVAVLKSLKLIRDVSADTFVRVTVALNKTGIAAAVNAKQIKPAELKKYGLRWVQHETFSIKVRQAEVHQQPE